MIANFIRAICENPADDLPRLVFCDFLEENGDHRRARFIRQQLAGELASVPLTCIGSEIESVMGKQPHELFRNADKDGCWVSQNKPGQEMEVRYTRGFVSEIRCTLAAFVGATCQFCRGDGQMRGNPGWGCNECGGQGRLTGVGRTEGIAAAVFREHPVEKIVITDAIIHPSGGNDTYYVGGLGSFPKEYWSRLENHRSRHTALAALNAVCVAYGRAKAFPDAQPNAAATPAAVLRSDPE